MDQFVSRFLLKPLRSPMVATDSSRNKERQKKAIDYFAEHDLLIKIATERYFANNFLSVYFHRMINIDCITKTNGKYNIIEIKFKYESKDGYFGINTGQMQMFQFFSNLKFNIYHFILYNKTHDLNISIFGYLEIAEDKIWIYKKISSSENYRTAIAPKMTSVSGEFIQPYFKLPLSEFEKNKIRLEFANSH